MRVLGVNAGNGVILYPFKRYLVGNIEPRAVFHTKGDLQWNLNFNNIPLVKKWKIGDELPDYQDIDIIISHPDCGHSSILAYSRAKKMSKPNENLSVRLFIESLNKYRPKVFLMENLTKFIENYGKKELELALDRYNLVFISLSVAELGNSQVNRNRLLIIGVDKKLPKFIHKVFYNIYKVNELKYTGQLLRGLGREDESIAHVREDKNEIITLYAGYKDVIANIQREWLTNRSLDKRWKVLDRKFTTAPGVYRNQYLDFPATVRPTNRQYNPNGEMMSPRELARIQGISDEFNIYYDTKFKKYCINKGRVTVTKTPPMEVGIWFFKQLIKVKKYL